MRVANKRATTIAKTDGAKLTAELVGVAVTGSVVEWATEADAAGATELVFIEGSGMTEVERAGVIVVDALV